MNDIIILGTISEDTALNLIDTKKDVLLKTLSNRFISDCRNKFIENNDIMEGNAEKAVAIICPDAVVKVSEYGVFGALWDFASERKTGIEVDLNSIPILQETVEICEVFDINPYVSSSNNVYILSVKSGFDAVNICKSYGIYATLVGKETAGNDRVIINGEEKRFLTPTDRADYFKDGLK